MSAADEVYSPYIIFCLKTFLYKPKMELPTVTPRVVYGHRVDIKHNGHYVTDNDFMYVAAASVIFQNMIDNSQTHLLLPENSYLSRLEISPRRSFFAALMISKGLPKIHIYETDTLKRKRSLALPPDATTTEIVSLCFSFDERLVVVITGHPDWMMLVFNWERGKIESSTKANLLTNPLQPVKEIVCSPVDVSILLIYGQGIFRLLNMQEAVWRQYGFQKAENYDITSCCFLTGDRILCGTSDGLLLLIELAELKFIFEADVVDYIHAKADKEDEMIGVINSSMVLDRARALEEEEKKERAVRALTVLTNGFAYACGTVVYFFEKKALHKYQKRNEYEITDKDYRENQTIQIHTVMHLTVNKSENRMIALTRKSQIFGVKLWGPAMDIAGRIPFTHLWMSLHNGRIKDLAICLWKPIFMTCGEIDRTVRVWNYETSTLEMMKQYQEDIHSVSLHPSGLYAAVGFSDKLRFMIVLIDDLQVCRELPIRECPISQFNMYGHLLAAVNRNTIVIYNIITFQSVANLKGHSAAIKCLKWTEDDKKLVSCGMDGAIYEWDTNTFKRIGEIVHKGLAYLGCAVMNNGKNIFAVGSDGLIKEFRGSNVLRSLNLPANDLLHVVISRSNQLMFCGCNDGHLLTIKMPVEEFPECSTFSAHAWKIDHIKLSMDDRTLITCSAVGTISVWNLENLSEGQAICLDKDDYKFEYFNGILISKIDLEEKLATVKDLTQRIYELEMEHAYQMRHIHTIYGERINDIHAIYQQALEELKATFEILEANYNTELNDIGSDINVLKERHETEMLEMEAKYNAQLIIEYDKLLNLEKEKEQLLESYTAKLENLQLSKEKTIDELTRINESKIYNLNKMVEEAREEINKETAEHEEITRKIEDLNDSEIENLKAQCEKALKDARESNMRLKGESGVLKKKIITCEKERDLIQMDIISAKADNDKFKHALHKLEKDILDLKKEVGERDLRIQDKEKRIYDLKRKDQEYERYKFVLNCRIKELKNLIEPMDKEIKERKEQIAEMEVELYDLQKINLSLDSNLGLMREKLGNAYKSLHSCKSKFVSIMQVVKTVKTSIFTASGHTQNYKGLKDSVKKLYLTYITDKEFEKSLRSDEECIAELKRQKVYLEGIVKNLGKKVDLNKHTLSPYGMTYMETNWRLMDEIYKIRKKLKMVQSKTQDIEMLITIKMTKDCTPKQALKTLREALRGTDEIREDCKVNMNEALTKAALMKEEVDGLMSKILHLEHTYFKESLQKKKKGDALQFDIPSII